MATVVPQYKSRSRRRELAGSKEACEDLIEIKQKKAPTAT